MGSPYTVAKLSNHIQKSWMRCALFISMQGKLLLSLIIMHNNQEHYTQEHYTLYSCKKLMLKKDHVDATLNSINRE